MTIKERITVLEEIADIISSLQGTIEYWDENGYYDNSEYVTRADAKRTVIKELEKLAKGI